ncbi:hypothetical protein JTB14_035715 [Gonioctena quinquepunctata]|nr:hypothetical protein JTB14_035715 [Gonioctena quinquepunctata]
MTYTYTHSEFITYKVENKLIKELLIELKEKNDILKAINNLLTQRLQELEQKIGEKSPKDKDKVIKTFSDTIKKKVNQTSSANGNNSGSVAEGCKCMRNDTTVLAGRHRDDRPDKNSKNEKEEEIHSVKVNILGVNKVLITTQEQSNVLDQYIHLNDDTNPNQDGWQKIQRRARRSKNNVGESNEDTNFKSAANKPKCYMYIYRVGKEVKEKDIKSFIENKLNFQQNNMEEREQIIVKKVQCVKPQVKDKAGALAVSKVPATETNSRETETKSKQYIRRKEVSAAVEEVKTLSVIGNIQNLHKEEIYQRQNQYINNSSDEWSHVQNKRKRRKFLVGRTEDTCVVETIPKVVSLHVTRLHPKTKPIDLKNFLALHIPDVECEPHNSRKPEVYSSMKPKYSDKLPFAVNEIVQEMHIEISQIIERTTQYVKDYIDLLDQGMVLEELIQILFKQLKAVADHQNFFLKCLDEACVEHSIEINPYNINYYWSQVQAVLQSFLTDYLDIQNVTSVLQINNINSISDISMYFSRRKQTVKRNFLFKFDDSSSALSLNNAIKSSKKDKFLICPPHPNNVLIIYTPFMCFIEELEQKMGVEPHGSSNLYQFITLHVSNAFLKRKSDEIMDQVESCVRAADAWKATILLDSSADYKPLLVSTVAVERCIREWKTILTSLPNYSETIAEYSCKALKEYRDTCDAAYKGIVQPHSEDKWICSATWLRDEDISRFLKSLPNWLNLKAQQESHARSERNKRTLKKEHPSEEESPEDVRMRNRREAEILASNLGEGGVSAGEILSDMSSLKELAQLQESMEWFSIRMFEFTSDFRTEPPSLSPPKHDNGHNESSPPVSAATLQQLTSVAQEFDELANTCLLLLHLEVRVQCFHYLLNQTQHNKETQEPDPKVLELNRVLATVDEAIISSLHPRKCKVNNLINIEREAIP